MNEVREIFPLYYAHVLQPRNGIISQSQRPSLNACEPALKSGKVERVLLARVLCLLKTSRIRSIKYLERVANPAVSVKILRMIAFLRHLFGWILSTCGSRKSLALENLALRQQMLALHSERPRRRFSTTQKLFWVVLRRFWSGWQKPLVLVTPRTVIECTVSASGCIGNAYLERDDLEVANPWPKKFER